MLSSWDPLEELVQVEALVGGNMVVHVEGASEEGVHLQ